AAHLAAETEPRARPVRKEGPHPVVPGPVLDGASAVGALGSLGEHDGHGSDPPIAWASSSRAAADPHASKRSSRAVSSAISGRAGGPLRARLTAHRTAPRAPSIWDRMRSCTACKRRKVRRSTASRLGAALPVVSSATVRTSGPRAKVLELFHDLAHGRAVVAHRGMVPESSQGLDGSAPGA